MGRLDDLRKMRERTWDSQTPMGSGQLPVAPNVGAGPLRSEYTIAGSTGHTVSTVVGRGRPLGSLAHLAMERTKPWVAEGMSRATWYRRRKNKSQK